MEKRNRTKVVVLGSTGSIGSNTLNVIRHLTDEFDVVGLSAGRDWENLTSQIREFRPKAAAILDGYGGEPLKKSCHELECQLNFGEDGLCGMIDNLQPDIVVDAITGWAGFRPCLAALEKGCRLALANKESLVVGGKLVQNLLQNSDSTILPVDSEESAIFQSLTGGKRSEVRKIFLTASGGPFHEWPAESLEDVTPEQALCHPNWDMGRKITVDSATLMNKALEIVETRWLFDIEPEKIQVLIHPQSVIHSMVEYEDASIIAQLGAPDMQVPIQYALTYPQRVTGPGESLDFSAFQQLELRAASGDEFPALEIGHRVAEMGGTSGAVMNAANEVAVEAFLDEKIGFTDIVKSVNKVLTKHKLGSGETLEELENADRWAREETIKCI